MLGMSGVLTTLVGSVSSMMQLLRRLGGLRFAGVGCVSSGWEILHDIRWTDMSLDDGNLPQQTTQTKMYFFCVK